MEVLEQLGFDPVRISKLQEGRYRLIRSGTLIGYGLGDFGINLYFMSVMTFLLVFYTDVMGIPPLTAAMILHSRVLSMR